MRKVNGGQCLISDIPQNIFCVQQKNESYTGLKLKSCGLLYELCSSLTFTSHLCLSYYSQHRDRTIPVLIIGILVFLPGFYHLRIAYYASKGYRGYSYDDIPDFDD